MIKGVIVTLILALFIGCGTSEEQLPVDISVSNFDWLTGNWTRTNEEPGMTTRENWNKINDSTYTAHSYTLKGQDTLWQEFTTLSPYDGKGWYFRVKVPDQKNSTDFRLVEADAISFACENKKNKFPKRIYYKRNEQELQAEISGGGDNVSFVFKKD